MWSGKATRIERTGGFTGSYSKQQQTNKLLCFLQVSTPSSRSKKVSLRVVTRNGFESNDLQITVIWVKYLSLPLLVSPLQSKKFTVPVTTVCPSDLGVGDGSWRQNTGVQPGFTSSSEGRKVLFGMSWSCVKDGDVDTERVRGPVLPWVPRVSSQSEYREDRQLHPSQQSFQYQDSGVRVEIVEEVSGPSP